MTLNKAASLLITLLLQCLLMMSLWAISVTVQAIDHNREIQEVNFREQPEQLYQELYKATEFPLAFDGPEEFNRVALDLGFSPEELHRDLEILARLNLESNVTSDTKIPDVNLLITQLTSIASTPLEDSVVLMLKARLVARDKQDYQGAVALYNQALSKIIDEQDVAAILFKYTLHEHLSSLHYLLRQEVPALSHLNRYRAIAYQLRNDYFIAQTEAAMGLYYNRKNELAKSLQHYSEAFSLANRLDYPSIKAHSQFQLARTYRDLEQWKDALKNANEAASSFQHLGQQPSLSQAFTLIATIYAAQDEWNKAVDVYLNAQQVDERIGNLIGQAINFHNIGDAYEHLGNRPSALKYLQLANDIFRQKSTLHYLVYNELLFAKISLDDNNWSAAKHHGNEALSIATEKGLIDEQIEALGYLATAYRQLNELTSALDTLDKQLRLTEKNNEGDNKDTDTISLTEQKLKFELSLLQSKASRYIEDKQQSHMLLFILMLTLIALIPGLVFCIKRIKRMRARQNQYRHALTLEPVTQLKGYQGLLAKLRSQHQPHTEHYAQSQASSVPIKEQQTLALAIIDNLMSSELGLGLSQSNLLHHHYVTHIEIKMSAKVYVIRPGLLALYFNTCMTAEEVSTQLKSCITELNLAHSSTQGFVQPQRREAHYTLGHINLPLHGNPDIKISPELEFETVQFALSAALSMEQQDSYLSLRTLNFAPAAIFFKPLYLNLTQAVQRGIVRAESNHALTDVGWPKH